MPPSPQEAGKGRKADSALKPPTAGARPPQPWVSDSRPPELWRITLRCFQPPGSRALVTVALGEEHRPLSGGRAGR